MTWVGREQKQEGLPKFQRGPVVGMARGGTTVGKGLLTNEVARGVHYDVPGAKAADWSRESIKPLRC